jgi:hypothetical protein
MYNITYKHNVFFKFLQFLFFINLCDSFKIINYFKYKTNNIIYMGCDYYIETNLCINYNDNMHSPHKFK